jgi:restriction system protein
VARRGFFAELQRQARLASRERERLERETVRAHHAAARAADQALKASIRTQLLLERASAAESKRLEKEAREARIAAKEAEVAEKNALLDEVYCEVDALLGATLGKDDYVDLQALRIVVQQPPFSKPELETSLPLPEQIPFPQEPVFVPPEPPKGLAALFGKSKYAAALVQAEATHQRALEQCQKEREQVVVRRREMLTSHVQAEAKRKKALELARIKYAEECAAREADAAERNRELDELIANLGYGTVDAVQEYVSIVLSNSVYPDHFPVRYQFSFDPTSAELKLIALLPGPESIPTAKAYKYAKSADEITSTELSQKAIKDRYEGAVHQVALRTLHEVFEADRRGLIRTIALTVGTEATHPATGILGQIPLVVVGVERESFLAFDLSSVVPEATLKHLGAALSKNPFALTPAETKGVRRS